jgi:uncharacterized RDD family membrane protein YckC
MTNPFAPPQAEVEDITERRSVDVPAERGARLGAAILDSIFFIGAVYVPLVVMAFAVAQAETVPQEADAYEGIALTAGIVALIGFAVWAWFTLRFMARNGQSIAKKLLQIKVVRANGSRVSLGRLIWLRNVVVWILSLIPLFGIVDVLFIFGEARQCLHDRIADTIVIKA